ncbi:MAG: hypothetical protein JWM90_2003 [Thermoleophilia bacterium]|nr:hypothetical protein [Thermoleophilia bacterium]
MMVSATTNPATFQFRYEQGQFLPLMMGSRTLERTFDASWDASGAATGTVQRRSLWAPPMSEGQQVAYREKTTPLTKDARPDAIAALRAAVDGAAILEMRVSDQTKRDLGVTIHWKQLDGTWQKPVMLDKLSPVLRSAYDAAIAIALR